MTKDKIYFLSAFFGLLAGNMFNYAIVIFSHSLSEDKSFASTVFFIAYLPFLLFSFRAGFVLDKYSRKLILFLSQLVTASCGFFPGLLTYLGYLDSSNKEILYLFAFINGIAMTFIMPGRFTVLGELVTHDKIAKNTVILNFIILFGFALSPVISGIIRDQFSYATLLMVTGSIYFFSAMILSIIPIPHEKVHNHPHRKEAFMESFNFVKKEKLVNQALLAMFFGMFIVGVIQVLLPDFAKEILKLNEKERGTLMGMLGLGLLLGSLFSLSIAKLIGRGKCILLSISLSGILMIVIATITNPILSMSVLFIAGLFLGTVTSFVPSIIQAATPNNLRGRVMSYFSLVFLLTPAISGLGYGFLADKIGLVNVFIISGIVAISMGLLGWIILTDLKIADKKLNLPS